MCRFFPCSKSPFRFKDALVQPVSIDYYTVRYWLGTLSGWVLRKSSSNSKKPFAQINNVNPLINAMPNLKNPNFSNQLVKQEAETT